MDILKIVREYKSIAISAHISPDGDAIGSCISLTLYLRKVYPEKDIRLFLEPIPDCFKTIEGSEIVDSSFSGFNPEVYFLLDATPERLAGGKKLWENAKVRVNIDHHISNADGSGDINLVVPTASSTAELIFNLIDEKLIDKKIASWIYIGIIHDTGMLKYAATSPETLRICARLMEENIDTQYIVDTTFYEKTYSQNVACARIVLSSRLLFDGKVIIGQITAKEMKEYGIEKKDLDGVINQLRITTGVEVAIFMYPMNADTVKVSMRSKEKVDVSKICQTFGGGGHIRASGFYTKGQMEHVEKKILDLLALEEF
ncbi:MAG: bifunctional oligoribonuclease/PAP phosphatase NrnA [Lachnospiraceae bacterium]|nr:bifunctional oligoribonuclease/PAP phosphatase NrnA [Lachnospiraceae bacterium]MBP5275713.1 bifunctional oligoribonuclease/PAP phosphatase NrnA [Lachnospiraceae bacterium]MBP5565510.1 bifunctional oligoribonuclease/PAP phosphatase NrnA [Lachnospiraceae bacterium]MBQ4276242.1 bifunctional oligoribonuclease/PAP phosphatase NrnA [Lachnospiraceae bacterium]